MPTVIHEEQIKSARKDHECMACVWILECGLSYCKFTFTEWRAVAKAKASGWKIRKGEAYIRQRNTDGSDIWTFKAIPEIHAICLKYGYYPD